MTTILNGSLQSDKLPSPAMPTLLLWPNHSSTCLWTFTNRKWKKAAIGNTFSFTSLHDSFAHYIFSYSGSNERGERSDRSSGGGLDRSSDRGGSRERYSNNTNNLGLAAQILAKPEALTTALTTLASLSSLGNLGGGLLAGLTGSGGSGSVTGVHRHRSGGNYGGSRSSRSNDDNDRRDSKRSKFAPY